MDQCIFKMTQTLDLMAPAQKLAARYLLEHSSDAVGQTIDRVATASGASKATIVRMCKALGYKGYKDFSFAFSSDLLAGDERRITFRDITDAGDDLEAILRHVSQTNLTALNDTMRMLDLRAMEKAVIALHNATRVDFYGVGVSGLVALDAQMKFQRLCKESQASLDPHVQVVTASRLKAGDAAVLFSYSGETSDILDTLAAAKRSEATTISVTRPGGNRLSRAADIALYVASCETLIRSSATASRICMMHLTDLLFSAVAARGYDQYKHCLERTHLEGREKKRRSSARSRR